VSYNVVLSCYLSGVEKKKSKENREYAIIRLCDDSGKPLELFAMDKAMIEKVASFQRFSQVDVGGELYQDRYKNIKIALRDIKVKKE